MRLLGARVARLPQVAHVHVIGITSGDLGAAHAWEHNLGSVWSGKVTYWSTGVDTRWSRWLGLGPRFRSFPDRATLVEAARQELAATPMDTYFSIDKDAFSADEVRTNWDQGVLLRADLKTLAQALHGQVVGSDVTGDVSVWHYRTAWKRWLSAADGQDTAHQDKELPQWQARQNAFNWQIVELLDARARAETVLRPRPPWGGAAAASRSARPGKRRRATPAARDRQAPCRAGCPHARSSAPSRTR